MALKTFPEYKAAKGWIFWMVKGQSAKSKTNKRRKKKTEKYWNLWSFVSGYGLLSKWIKYLNEWMNEYKWVLSFGKETKSIVKLTSVIIKLTFVSNSCSQVYMNFRCCPAAWWNIKWIQRDHTVSIKCYAIFNKTLNRASQVPFTPFGCSLFSASQ